VNVSASAPAGGAPSPAGAAAGHPRLSACIIALDEERDIAECLHSVAFCDEIVVVDSGSHDRTREIAAAAGAIVVQQSWLGFAAQRNVAIDHARGRWILEVDADERISPPLAAEISAWLADPPEGVRLGALPRREVVVGHRLGPAVKYPVYQHRLFDPAVYRHDESVTVHEGLVPAGRVHAFTGELEHRLARTWPQFAAETVAYARLDAAQLQAPRTLRSRASGAIIRPLAKFAWRICVSGGWRDGLPGVAMIARDCVYDSIVWLSPAPEVTPARQAAIATGHYGSRRWPRGEPHVIAVGYGTGGDAARRWAEAAQAEGLDVTLMTEHAVDPGVPARRLGSRSLVTLLRALSAEEGVRTVDAVIPFGARARLRCRLVPRALFGVLHPPSRPPAPALLREQVMAARERGVR
jgi:hypothetical protein